MITLNGKITYSQTNLIKGKGNEWTDVMQWCKLITSFGMKHELFNIGFDFQKNKKNGICNKLILLLNQILHYQVSLFTRFLLKVVFLISFKDTGANPLIVSRAPIRAVKSSGSVSLLTRELAWSASTFWNF